MAARSAFDDDDDDGVPMEAQLQIRVREINGQDVSLDIVAIAPGLPELNISKNVLRAGDTLSIRDLSITLRINIH